MSDPSTQRLNDLLNDIAESATSLAKYSLFISDHLSIDHPNDAAAIFKTMRSNLISMEESVAALMNYSGVSWDALAAYYGVSRQSLHRRLASGAAESWENAHENERYNRAAIDENIKSIRSSVAYLESSFTERLPDAIRMWQERRKRPRWWQR
jgi:hypothetical protein